MSTRPPAGPKMLRNLERSLGALDGLGLDKATALTTLMAVGTYVLGAVLREQQEANGERYIAELFEDVPEAEKQAVIREFTERIRTSGHFPRMVAMLDEGVDPDAAETRDERFEFGLDCLLDGIAARLSRVAAALPIQSNQDHQDVGNGCDQLPRTRETREGPRFPGEHLGSLRRSFRPSAAGKLLG